MTEKEIKTCIQFKKEINYSSSLNTIISSNQVFFFIKWEQKRIQLINKPTNGETRAKLSKRNAFVYQVKKNWSLCNIMFSSIREKNTIILLFYQSNDGGRTFSNKAFLDLLVPKFFSRALSLFSIFNTTIFDNHK